MNDAASAQRIADLARERMAGADAAVRALGIAVVAIAPGRATATMAVDGTKLNSHATCHGGLIATLADTAFAYACNSRDVPTVAAGFSIDFVAPARPGDVLSADAAEIATAGRSGVYDVVVTNQRGERVAVFRGRSHAIGPRREGAVACP